MGNKKDKLSEDTEVIEGFELKSVMAEDGNKVVFAFLRLDLKLLTQTDLRAAEAAARLPGGTRKKPKQDDDKFAAELLGRCVLGWEHKDGGKLLLDGQELKCTPKNIVMLADHVPGLASFVFEHCKDADRMYRTLDEQEIKN